MAVNITIDDATEPVYIEITDTTTTTNITVSGGDTTTITIGDVILSPHTLDSHSNVTITSNSSGEILKWNGSAWVNNTLAEAGIAGAGAAPAAHTLDSHSNVTITSNSSGEILKWNGSAWVNNTLAEAGIAATSHNHAASDITSGTLADARVAESNVTQHEAALEIDESQLINLKFKRATATGTNTYAITVTDYAAYGTRDAFIVVFTNANTGAATLNVNSLGAKSLKKSVSTDVASGDILAGQAFLCVYDGTNFQVIGLGGGGDAYPDTTFTAITGSSISLNPTEKINNYEITVSGDRTFSIDFTGVAEGNAGAIVWIKSGATERYIDIPTNAVINYNDIKEANAKSTSTKTITGAANNGSGLIRITATAHGYSTGNRVNILAVGGTVEAIGRWTITVIDANTFDLQGSAFITTYTSGGTAQLQAYFLAITETDAARSEASFIIRDGKFHLNMRRNYFTT